VNQINEESLIEHVLMFLEADRFNDLFFFLGKRKFARCGRSSWL